MFKLNIVRLFLVVDEWHKVGIYVWFALTREPTLFYSGTLRETLKGFGTFVCIESKALQKKVPRCYSQPPFYLFLSL